MSQISLIGTLRTCKVDQGWASRIQSDRFENPLLMVCPVWTGFDSTNRAVCMDSYYTKSPGCNSPLDRVDVENALRPKYMEYINLDAEGFRANQDIYSGSSDRSVESCKDVNTNMDCYQSGIRRINLNELPKISGNFGLAPNGAQVYPTCENYPDKRAMRQEKLASTVEHYASCTAGGTTENPWTGHLVWSPNQQNTACESNCMIGMVSGLPWEQTKEECEKHMRSQPQPHDDSRRDRRHRRHGQDNFQF